MGWVTGCALRIAQKLEPHTTKDIRFLPDNRYRPFPGSERRKHGGWGHHCEGFILRASFKKMQGRQNNDKLHLLVIEDEGLWRDMLCLALSTQPRIEVVGTGSSGDDLESLCKTLKPDVLLIDADLERDSRPIASAHAMKEERPEMGVVVLASSGDGNSLSSLPSPDRPGWSYIVKQSLTDTGALIRAIEAAAAGLVVLDPAILAGTLEARYSRLGRLTPRQMDVLHLMAKGYSNGAIAKALVLEEKSVENHINAIFSQLVVNRDPSVHPRVRAVITYLQESRDYSARAS